MDECAGTSDLTGGPRRPVERLISPFQRFFHLEASGGIMLLACTVVALVWANLPWAESYHSLWETEVSVGFGDGALSKTLIHWINDGLMVIFFFVVGLEIKREILTGELNSARKAALPVVAALGGMAVPAAIYAAFNAGGSGADGWGVPMATDIAFAIGVMSLLGRRVPLALKVFVTALAIADDLGAVLVIAVFYTDHISLLALGVSGAFFAGMIGLSLAHVRHPLPYALVGLAFWVAMLKSGVHPTVAGVLGAMTIPCRTQISPLGFVARAKRAVAVFGDCEAPKEQRLVNEEQEQRLDELESAIHRVQTPLGRLERALHPWITFVIMPLFALANAGVTLSSDLGRGAVAVPLGIVLGLVLGKPVGIVLFAWLAVRLRLADKPEDISWKVLLGGGLLAGIGFTMSLFIATLAFGDGPILEMAKVGVLAASLVAGVAGGLLLAFVGTPPPKEDEQ